MLVTILSADFLSQLIRGMIIWKKTRLCVVYENHSGALHAATTRVADHLTVKFVNEKQKSCLLHLTPLSLSCLHYGIREKLYKPCFLFFFQ